MEPNKANDSENQTRKTDQPNSPILDSTPEITHEGQGECHWNGLTYSNGSINCLNGVTYRCSNGSWISTGVSC